MKGGIYPIVLAGGTGTRLWPLSKKKCPKQFLDLLDSGQTLFQQAVKRAASISNFSPVIVGSSSHRFLLSKQLKEIGLDESSVLLEPAGRNTASSVIAAVLQVRKVDPDARVCIIPSDHFVDSDDLFAHVVVNLASELDEGDIGLVGVKPSEPSSQYGYIQLNSTCIYFINHLLIKSGLKKITCCFICSNFLITAFSLISGSSGFPDFCA